LGNGRYSVFDNATSIDRASRMIVFSLAGDVATIERVIDDPTGSNSAGQGSAGALDDAEQYWVINWGCSATGLSVMAADGTEVARLRRATATPMPDTRATVEDSLDFTVSYRAKVLTPTLISPSPAQP
ncbi:MAG TPA: hypothetical protein PLV68_03290, partial [Ilumatobacteraceae bacterium]|nr:hypothetical protein [Ilumatobacteraceae bacterium]